MIRRLAKARKKHECTLCEKTIQVGEKYCSMRLTPWDGFNDDFHAYKAHEKCDKVWSKVGMESDWEIMDPRDFMQYLEIEDSLVSSEAL